MFSTNIGDGVTACIARERVRAMTDDDIKKAKDDELIVYLRAFAYFGLPYCTALQATGVPKLLLEEAANRLSKARIVSDSTGVGSVT